MIRPGVRAIVCVQEISMYAIGPPTTSSIVISTTASGQEKWRGAGAATGGETG